MQRQHIRPDFVIEIDLAVILQNIVTDGFGIRLNLVGDDADNGLKQFTHIVFSLLFIEQIRKLRSLAAD